jgi:DNA-directed RNA polymerase specialized sigma24 family protein
MDHLQRTTAQESYHAATADREAPRSPLNGKHDDCGDSRGKAVFENLLKTDSAFYRTESKHLAGRVAGLGVPPSEVEDVVAEVWLEAVTYRHRFAGVASERRLHCWLLRVGHSKAVDALRRLGRHLCYPLSMGEEGPIDGAEAQRATGAEESEWLTVLLEKVRWDNEESLRLLCAHFYEECPIQELARESGMTAKSVDGRIRRLLHKLRELAELTPHSGDAAP